MNSRQNLIVKELYKQQNYITSNHLAAIFNLSSKTIRNEVKNIETFQSDYGFEINSQRSKGYFLKIKDEDLFSYTVLNTAVKEITLDFNNHNSRVKYILSKLLLDNSYIKIEMLSKNMFVSKTTIQNDLKIVKAKLEKYNLELISKPHHGLKIIGEEFQKRFCISEYLFEHSDIGNNSYFFEVTDEESETIKNIIIKVLYNHNVQISDMSINNLLVHIVIALGRMDIGENIDQYYYEDLSKSEEYIIAENIVQEVEQCFDVSFKKEEIAYIALHLLGIGINQNDEVIQKIIEKYDINQLIEEMIEEVQRVIGINLAHDDEFKNALSLHLSTAFNRYKYQMNFRNPLLEMLKKEYPFAFDAALICSKIIEKRLKLKINESEVGYIALHFGGAIERLNSDKTRIMTLIVCASGISSSQLLKYRLQNLFEKDIDIIGISELYKVAQNNIPNAELIISTVPINFEIDGVKIIQVNPIMSTEDIQLIKEYVEHYDILTDDFIRSDLIFIKQELTTMEHVFDFAEEKLNEKQLIYPDFKQKLMEREEVAPTSYGNFVAVPHPITSEAKKTFLLFITLNKPIKWADKDVQWICFICLEKEPEHHISMDKVYEKISSVINGQEIVFKMINANDVREFIKLMK